MRRVTVSPAAAFAFALIVAGAATGSGGLLLAGVLTGLVLALQTAWARYGLHGLTYERHLSAPRLRWGETVDLDLVVRNAKVLPIPWLQIDDVVSHGAEIGGVKVAPSVYRGFDVMRSTWSIGWFQRVTRRVQVAGRERGIFMFTSAELRVADLFGHQGPIDDRPLRTVYRVVPRIVAVRSAVTHSPAAGASRAVTGLVEEPSLFAGVRPYQPGDSPRRIHWKATARLDRPVSRRFDAARERAVLLAVDFQTLPGPPWMLKWDDDLVEGLCVAALSLARGWIDDGVSVGLAANAYTDRPQRTVFLSPSAAPAQIALIADHLAAVSPYASVPFPTLLAGLARRAPLGCSVVGLSCRDPIDFAPVLRRLSAQGYRASHAAYGPMAGGWSARARAMGLPSAAYRLHPDWETADALERLA